MKPFRYCSSVSPAQWVLHAFCAVALASISGCDGDGKSTGASGDTPSIGHPDQPETAQVQINPDTIWAETRGQSLRLHLELQGVVDGSGKLDVNLETVDGAKEYDTKVVSFQAHHGKTTEVTVDLPLPPDVHAREELVDFNVHIDGTGASSDLSVRKSLLYTLDAYELKLQGPERITQGKEVAYRLTAEHPVTRAPVADRSITVSLGADGGASQDFQVKTDDQGSAEVKLSSATAGTYNLSAKSEAGIAPVEVANDVVVQSNGNKLLLTTDKPIYKPGQTIQLRALALERGGNTPLAAADTIFEVEDGKGNKILHKSIKTDAYGIAATPFTIGNIVNEGTFKVRAVTGDTTSEKTVQVSQYALPKFKIGITTDKTWYGPGEVVSGVIDAQYFFGKPVAGGDIDIEASAVDIGLNTFSHVMGKTDAEGRYPFSIQLPASLVGLPLDQGLALVSLKITATDSAGQAVVSEQALSVAPKPLRISLVPEATVLVSGLENHLALFVTDPLGAPVSKARVTLTPAQGDPIDLVTDAQGYADVSYTPAAGATSVAVRARSGDIDVSEQFDFQQQSGGEHLLVRTDKSIYDVGDTVNVSIVTDDPSGHVFVDWLNEGQAVDVRTLDADKGVAKFSFTVDETLLGGNRVEAYIVDSDGNIVRAGKNIFARKAGGLEIGVTSDKAQYAPGEPAAITFNVKDEAGNPTVAALGVQIVDEAVFALVDSQPGLLQTYFELEDEFATPHYEIRAPSADLTQLLFAHPDTPAAQTAAQEKSGAVLAALGTSPVMGLDVGSWASVVSLSNPRLDPYFAKVKTSLVALLDARLQGAIVTLQAEGCSFDSYWCGPLGTDLRSALAERVSDGFKAYDFWGNVFEVSSGSSDFITLKSAGPDEVKGTGDDRIVSISSSDLNLQDVAPELSLPVLEGNFDEGDNLGVLPPVDAPSGAGGSSAAGASGVPENPGDNGGSGPRVRKDFPETLYVNPAVITDPDGTATIHVDMADSITKWRLSAMANSQSGKLGGQTAGITVFQDFFVDIDFPATLTRGDQIEFPIAVYNYLDEAQTVSLELVPGDWFTALGSTAETVDLAPGEVKGVSFPVRVDQVGLRTLTVQAIGKVKSDAVARTVKVLPDGKEFPTVHSGSLSGSTEYTLNFPTNAVPGSESMYVNVFPSFLSQTVQGMDSLLQVPNGCFEQTTSTAWPNVLVTQYMTETGQITPEIQLKAESLMSAGYQRLLTFEHAGGGFSWFGEEDPKPYLSVTAFGVMEFSDMAKVHPVDQAMMARTVAWLVAQQGADGSWEGDQSEFFSFYTSKLRNTAFVLWALASAGYTGPEIDKGLNFVKAQLHPDTDDAYTLALVANAFALLAPNDATLTPVLTRLEAMKTETDGDVPTASWDSAGTQTNFYGSGDDAAVATTALVTHALLSVGGYPDLVNRGLNYLTSKKDPQGNFGSTQATIWTLRALILAATKGTEPAIGTFTVEVDGQPFQTVNLTQNQADVMTTVDMTSLAGTGDHDVALTFAGQGKPSYSLVGSYHLPWQEVTVPPQGPLSVSVSYDRTQLPVNDTAQATVTVTNNTASAENMTLVTVGIPPGFEIQTQSFDQYLAAGTLSRYELTGKQLILYITALAPNASQSFVYDLRALLPVKASDGGASVYPYYEPDKKSESPAIELEATAM